MFLLNIVEVSMFLLLVHLMRADSVGFLLFRPDTENPVHVFARPVVQEDPFPVWIARIVLRWFQYLGLIPTLPAAQHLHPTPCL